MNKIKVHYKDKLAYYKIAYFLKNFIDNNSVIVCVGTDRCIGDCLGPLVGTFLKAKNFPLEVYGTISEPIHALNINEKLQKITSIHSSCNIIGIDACLGNPNNIGEIQARDYPIHPGKGVGKLLPQVGKTSLIGIIDSSDNNELFASRNIRLNLVIDIAKVITHSLIHAYYFKELNNKREILNNY